MNEVEKTMDEAKKIKQIQKEALHLFVEKKNEYHDTIRQHGKLGALSRKHDILKRFQTMTKEDAKNINEEQFRISLRNTLLDIHNYAAILLSILDES